MQTGKPYAFNERGRRENNEDAIFPQHDKADETTRFFLVCDGMGGHENGEVASSVVCESFAAFLENVSPNDFNEDVFERALTFAYDELDKKDSDPESAKKMGTTLTFLYLNDKQAFMAHIGDSRIYHLRKNNKGEVSIVHVSSDHSLVNELLKAEVITAEEAANHPKKNIITRAMQPNLEKRCKADPYITQDVQAGDRFFLCSDGVWECFTDERLCKIVAENDDEAIINVIKVLCEENSYDNFSAWLVPVTEGIQSSKAEEKAEITNPPRRIKKNLKWLMKNLFFLTAFLLCALLASGQNYLQKANACFDKGDYECAKLNYNLWQGMDGSDMSAQIKKADDCLKTLILADGYFQDKEFEKARDRYKAILDKNSKDPYAKKQYDLCVTKLSDTTPIKPKITVTINTITQHNYIETAFDSYIEMIDVPGGAFTMGCTSCYGGGNPAHQETVSRFYIGKYEVTQAQWKAIMGSNPSHFQGDNLPVEQVSWNDAQEFINRLNAETGKNYRLPTEAEWEFATKGGTLSHGYTYSGSNNPNDVAWYGDNSDNTTHPVGSKSHNELGIYDMSGNVAEWCQDWYNSSQPVTRGGSWWHSEVCLRVLSQCISTPIQRVSSDMIGFRLACCTK